MFRYKINVLQELSKNGYTSYKIRKERLLGESYLSQIRRGEIVSWAAFDVICTLLKCQPGDILEHIPDEANQEARDEGSEAH